MHVDDMADAVVYLLGLDGFSDMVNIGTGKDVTIRELAELTAEITGFRGNLEFDASKPDGTPRKLLDVSRLEKMGGKPKSACGKASFQPTSGSWPTRTNSANKKIPRKVFTQRRQGAKTKEPLLFSKPLKTLKPLKKTAGIRFHSPAGLMPGGKSEIHGGIILPGFLLLCPILFQCVQCLQWFC